MQPAAHRVAGTPRVILIQLLSALRQTFDGPKKQQCPVLLTCPLFTLFEYTHISEDCSSYDFLLRLTTSLERHIGGFACEHPLHGDKPKVGDKAKGTQRTSTKMLA